MAEEKTVNIKSAPHSKGEEVRFSEAMVYMISLMSRIYRNQVLEALPQSTVNKFEDAAPGNFGKQFLSIANRISRKLIRRFSDKRIQDIVEELLRATNIRNRDTLYSRISKATGVSTEQLVKQEGLSPQTNANILETAQWAQQLRDDTLQLFTNNTLRIMTQGSSMEQILEQFDDMVEKRKNHAKFIARNQIANFNSVMTKLRAQRTGTTEGIWVTSDDDKVRPSHEDRDMKEFELSKGLYSSIDKKYLLPGVDFNCRCDYILKIKVPNNF